MTYDPPADCQYFRFVPSTHIEADHDVGGGAKMGVHAHADPVQRIDPTRDKREKVKSLRRANEHLREINDMAGSAGERTEGCGLR